MTQQQLKVGDQVHINDRSTSHAGATGKITFTSGGQYWVKLDDSGEIIPALHRWFLDPA